ncbi:MAG TPA: response regulator [Planctomycetaceae bacterium]|nr:response regulator [Planctomycetaceae bacterium]
MATVLVVDDSELDRQLVQGLLAKDEDLQVQFAVHGVDALEKIAQAAPDLVVTDLIMPEMDGLKLVTAVRTQYRHIPTILMTSKGSEELAVQALEAGAASYVPKRSLGSRLLDTVHHVLALAHRERSHCRLMGCMTRSECTFELENDSALIGPLISYVQQDCAYMGLCDEGDSTRVGVALEEALANALYHGNLGIGSDLRETDIDAYWKLVEERRRTPPYCNRRIHVHVSLCRNKGVFVIRDEGAGFDPSLIPDPTDPENLEKVSGRGVLLMQAFMDKVEYNDIGNTVTLIKYRDGNEDDE